MEETPRPTLQQIAAAAGVSRMTVSLALRDHPRIPAATRERIRAIARKLGYRPDPEVSKLMAYLRRARHVKHVSTLGLITTAAKPHPWQFNRHFAKFYKGATQRADELGYRIEEFWLKEPGLTSRRVSSILHARAIDGIIIGPLSRPSGHLSIDFSHLAAAEYGQNVWRPRLHCADHHQFQGMLLATRQLHKLGYRRVGLAVLEGYDRRVLHAWEGAFLFGQQRIAAKQRVPPLVTRTLDRAQFQKWFARYRPDAVVSSHLEVRDWLDDTGFVYLDWLDASNRCAGINQQYDLIAAAAVDLVVEQLRRNERGVPAHPKVVLIDGIWVDGPTVRRQG